VTKTKFEYFFQVKIEMIPPAVNRAGLFIGHRKFDFPLVTTDGKKSMQCWGSVADATPRNKAIDGSLKSHMKVNGLSHGRIPFHTDIKK